MKSKMMAIAVALCCMTAAVAQSTPTTPATTPQSNGVTHDCIMSTDAQAWASLGLTTDQTKRVQEIQTQCKKECDAMKGDANYERMRQSTLDKHDAAIRSALSPEQYTKWVAWCGTHGTKSSKDEGMKK